MERHAHLYLEIEIFSIKPFQLDTLNFVFSFSEFLRSVCGDLSLRRKHRANKLCMLIITITYISHLRNIYVSNISHLFVLNTYHTN